jgi:hypothetical protein
MILSENFKDLNTAEVAYGRVQPDIDAVPTDDLSAFNVDLVSATSIVLGVADRILAFRERMLTLPEFDRKAVDKLIDYALAAWYLYITNLPAAEPADADAILAEMQALRTKFLVWAVPLVAAGHFEQAAVDHIKEGSGQKDAASDVVALVGLYRARWDAVKGICGVTETDLTRAAEVGPLAFAIVSRRENKGTMIPSDVSLRIRRAWTLVDRSYAQCRRALQFLRFQEGDAEQIAPNLRHNSGRSGVTASPPSPPPLASTSGSTTAPPTSGVQPGTTTGIGGNASPFVAAQTR